MATLTILAPGRCLPGDIEKYGVVGDVMAVNQVIADYAGPIRYAVCWWDKYLEALMGMRKLKDRNVDGVVEITRPTHGCPPINNSGLLAIDTANHMQCYDTVRVLGMPVDASGHYYDLDNTQAPENFLGRFFLGCVEEWEEELAKWPSGKFKVASGNLLKYFDKL